MLMCILFLLKEYFIEVNVSMIEGLIGGAIAGVAYGIVGYVKANENLDNFDWKQFGSTVLGSAVIGAYAFYVSGSIDVVSASAVGVVVTQFSKKIVGIIVEELNKRGWY
jgi:hypothetical protein